MNAAEYRKAYRVLTALLREQREAAGLTQTELANKIKETQSFVSKVENGERRVDLVELENLCAGLGIKLSDLIREYLKRRG